MKKLSRYIIILIPFCVLATFAQQMDSLTIKYNFVNSIPQNADVYLNDVKIGSTPLYFTVDSNVTEMEFTLKLKGYADHNYTVPAGKGLVNETFRLVPLRSSLKTSIVHENKSYAFPKKLKVAPMILSSAVTAVSAVLAYYYKSLAIDKQDEFYLTGDAALLDDKKKYDVIGGVSLAVFQLGFAALLYFHFIE